MSLLKTSLKLARDCLQRKDYEAALTAADQVLSLDEDNYNALVFSGLAAFNLGKYERSESSYLRAIKVSSNLAMGWLGLSSLYEKTKQWTLLASTLDKLIELFHSS